MVISSLVESLPSWVDWVALVSVTVTVTDTVAVDDVDDHHLMLAICWLLVVCMHRILSPTALLIVTNDSCL